MLGGKSILSRIWDQVKGRNLAGHGKRLMDDDNMPTSHKKLKLNPCLPPTTSAGAMDATTPKPQCPGISFSDISSSTFTEPIPNLMSTPDVAENLQVFVIDIW